MSAAAILATALGVFQTETNERTALLSSGFQPPSAPTSTATPSLATGARLPLYFEANEGQVDRQVEFLFRGKGHTLFLTREEAVLSLRDSWLHMKFAGSNPQPELSGLTALPGKTHYLIGNDRARWHTHIPHYARVRYSELYAGIDLVFYGNEGQLEYDFIVSPGADPGVIRLAVKGVDDLTLNPTGDLVLSLAAVTGAGGPEEGGEGSVPEAAGGDEVPENGRGAPRGAARDTPAHLTLRAPVLYQEVEGERRVIAGSYVLLDDSEVGFRIGDYDPSHQLVIDPVLSFSTYIGGEDDEEARGIAVDGEGNAYIVGTTESISYPLAPASAERARASLDVFVSKLNVDSATLVYTLFIGTNVEDRGGDIAVDAQGYAYITGGTYSDIFPTVDPVQPATGGDADAFVSKLSLDGSALLYSTYLGGTDQDAGTGIVLDAAGSAYVIGTASSADFPTANALQPDRDGTDDAFVAKLSPAGSTLTFSTYLGGSGTEFGAGIDVDGAGNVYVTGGTFSTDFPTANPFSSILVYGFENAFVTKLNAAGSALVYSTYLGGSSFDKGSDIAVDGAGGAYVVGRVESTDFPTTPGAPQDRTGGGVDAFVTKFAPSGSSLVYSTYLGGGANDEGTGIAVDSGGNAFVTGHTSSSNFPMVKPSQATLAGTEDAFVTAFGPVGQGLYSTYLGGDAKDEGQAIALDRRGDVYLTGNTDSSTFPTVRPYDGTANGLWDVFLTKLVMPQDFWIAAAGVQYTSPGVAVQYSGEGDSPPR